MGLSGLSGLTGLSGTYKADQTLAGNLSIRSPVTRQVYQRNGSDLADVIITGTYNGPSMTVEAQFNGGGFSTISATMPGGDFTLTLPAQAKGAGSLVIRNAANNSDSVTVLNVGVGDVFIVAGQSNHNEQATNGQGYTNPTYFASIFNGDGATSAWENATTANCRCYLPLLGDSFMTSQSCPIAFIVVAVGGTTANQWQSSSLYRYTAPNDGKLHIGDGQSLQNRALALYNAANTYGAKGILWHQGEQEISTNYNATLYQAQLTQVANDFYTNYSLPTFMAKLELCSDASNVAFSNQAAINTAITNVGGTGHIIAGPDFSDLSGERNSVGATYVHLKSDTSVGFQGSRWWTILGTYFGWLAASGFILNEDGTKILTEAGDGILKES